MLQVLTYHCIECGVLLGRDDANAWTHPLPTNELFESHCVAADENGYYIPTIIDERVSGQLSEMEA